MGVLKGLLLIGFREILQPMRFGEVSKRGTGGIDTEAAGVEQDQASCAGPVLTSGGRSERITDPLDGAPDRAQVGVIALELQIAIPARALVQALGQGAHEGEVAAVEFARQGGGLFHRPFSGTSPAARHRGGPRLSTRGLL